MKDKPFVNVITVWIQTPVSDSQESRCLFQNLQFIAVLITARHWNISWNTLHVC